MIYNSEIAPRRSGSRQEEEEDCRLNDQKSESERDNLYVEILRYHR